MSTFSPDVVSELKRVPSSADDVGGAPWRSAIAPKAGAMRMERSEPRIKETAIGARNSGVGMKPLS